MNNCQTVGVFGISGVGKSTLISKALDVFGDGLHLQASALIKSGLAAPTMQSEDLRRRSSNHVVSNQEILVSSFWRSVRAQDHELILFDGHLIVDTDDQLLEIPLGIIGRLNLVLMVHVEENVAKIVERRSKDSDRKRPVRSETVLKVHQLASRKLCESYARSLGIEMQIVRPSEQMRFVDLLSNLVR